MDEIDDKENEPVGRLPSADEDVMKSEGVEIAARDADSSREPADREKRGRLHPRHKIARERRRLHQIDPHISERRRGSSGEEPHIRHRYRRG